MNIIEKTRRRLASETKRIPRKIKASKRWRINLTELENYLDHTKGIDKEIDIKIRQFS